MPVLSPHRSSASALTGSYRSTFSSSSLDRPSYYSSGSYAPRITSYSERFSSRSYTDADGRRIFSRSGSITEDGITTRYREETRDGSVRRDSISRDSGISSIRENSILDYPRRDSSLSRENSRISTINIHDDVAELRNKYSPSNYIPAVYRKNENISRSKSINDIGLPPIEIKSKKKVNDSVTVNNCSVISNSTNTDNGCEHDDNGNRASVADLCKKFDDKLVVNGTAVRSTIGKLKKAESGEILKPKSAKIDAKADVKVVKKPKAADVSRKNSKVIDKGGKETSNVTDATDGPSINKISSDDTNGVDAGELDKSESVNNAKNAADLRGESRVALNDGNLGSTSRTSRVNDFASFIPTKSYDQGDKAGEVNGDVLNGGETCNMEDQEFLTKRIYLNELTTSPKLNARSAASPPTTSSLNASSTVTSPLTSSNSLNSSYSIRRQAPSDVLRREGSQRYYGDDEDHLFGRRSTSSPTAASSIKTLGLNGLKNIGNTCFMNSVIQCLSNTKMLMEYLRKDAYMKDINTTISGMKGALIKAFAEVIKELWSEDGSERVVNTVSLKSQIQRFAPRFMGYAQQDAQEFLRYLLEGLHEDVNRVTEKPKPIVTEIDEKLSDVEKAAESWQRYLRMDNSRIVDIFVGQLKSTLKCTHCGHSSVTFDPFWDLSLPIPQRSGQVRLSQCLEAFTREETLDGDEKPTCSRCKERRKCTKSFSIQKFPKILVIHLKRFSPTERYRGKLSVTVDFPLESLDMSNYAAEGISSTRYNLYAISNHSGTTYSGHYTAYCRHPYAHTWHEYNDSRVSSVSPGSVVSGEAYVLFYEQEGQRSHL